MKNLVFHIVKLSLYSVVIPMICGFTILLNIMEIYFIILTEMEKNVSSTPYIMNLSISDLILGVTIVCIRGAKAYTRITGQRNRFIIFISSSLMNISCIVSVLTLTMLSIDRLLVVLKPFKYKHFTQTRRKLICLGIWFIAFVFAIISFVRTGNIVYDGKRYIFLAVVALCGIPFPIIAYILIKRALKKSQLMSTGAAVRRKNEGERRLLGLCTKTFVAYLVCWIPYIIYAFYKFFTQFDGIRGVVINNLVYVIVFINSSVNPIILLHHFRVHLIIRDHFKIDNKTKPIDTGTTNSPING